MNKALLSLLLALAGLAIFLFGNPYYRAFPTNGNQAYYVALAVSFLALTAVVGRRLPLSRYRPAAYALFTASAALLAFSAGLIRLATLAMAPLQQLAMDKLSQFLSVVPVIVVLNWIPGNDLRAVYIARGRLRQGLAFGLLSFAGWGALAHLLGLLPAEVYRAPGSAIPWLLLFAFANAAMEELWFRGLFLKPYRKLIGAPGAMLVTAAVFGLSHVPAAYAFPGGGWVFGAVVFVLGAISAHAIIKHESLIGAVLFHAGYDLLVVGTVLMS